jgi:hypothetical protein
MYSRDAPFSGSGCGRCDGATAGDSAPCRRSVRANLLPHIQHHLPKGWVWRAFPGFDGTGAEFSNWTLAGRHGFSPDAAMPPGTFILWVNPLGEHGSVTRPTLRRSEIVRLPRGQARADHSYCAHSGRCFEITFQYGGNNVPERILREVNRALATIRAVPPPRS